MASPVMGDHSIAVLGEEEHLPRPRFRRQRPAVAEDDRLSSAPILVVDLSAVFGCDSSHFGNLLFDHSISNGGTQPSNRFELLGRALSTRRCGIYADCSQDRHSECRRYFAILPVIGLASGEIARLRYNTL